MGGREGERVRSYVGVVDVNGDCTVAGVFVEPAVTPFLRTPRSQTSGASSQPSVK